MRPPLRLPITPEQIVDALNKHDGDMAAAAKELDVSERTLYRRVAEFKIRARYEKAEAV